MVMVSFVQVLEQDAEDKDEEVRRQGASLSNTSLLALFGGRLSLETDQKRWVPIEIFDTSDVFIRKAKSTKCQEHFLVI